MTKDQEEFLGIEGVMGKWRLVGNEVQQQAQTKTMKAFSPYQSPEDKTDNSSHAPYLVYNAYYI